MFPALSKYLGRTISEPVNIPLLVTLQRTCRVAWEFWNTLPIPHVIVFLDFDAIKNSSDELSLNRVALLKDVVCRCPNLYIVITNYVQRSNRRDDYRKVFPRIIQPRIIGAAVPAHTGIEHGQIRVVRCDDFEYEMWLKAYLSKDESAKLPYPSYQSLHETSLVSDLTEEHVLFITSRYRWLMKDWM